MQRNVMYVFIYVWEQAIAQWYHIELTSGGRGFDSRQGHWVGYAATPLQRLWRMHPSPGLAGEAGSPTSRAKPTRKLDGRLAESKRKWYCTMYITFFILYQIRLYYIMLCAVILCYVISYCILRIVCTCHNLYDVGPLSYQNRLY